MPSSRDPKSDAQVAFRFSLCAKIAGLSPSQFTEVVGITRDQLYNYETLRTQLPADVALRTCRRLIINEAWLAICAQPPRPCVDLLSDPVVLNTNLRESYSAVFAREAIRNRYDELWKPGPAAILKKLVASIEHASPEEIARLQSILRFLTSCPPEGTVMQASLLSDLCVQGIESLHERGILG